MADMYCYNGCQVLYKGTDSTDIMADASLFLGAEIPSNKALMVGEHEMIVSIGDTLIAVVTCDNETFEHSKINGPVNVCLARGFITNLNWQATAY